MLNVNDLKVGERLIMLRKEYSKAKGFKKELSQSKFAVKIGIYDDLESVDQPHMTRLEKGYVRVTLEELLAYSKECGVPIKWILTGEGDVNVVPQKDEEQNNEYTFSEIARMFLYLHDQLGYLINADGSLFSITGGSPNLKHQLKMKRMYGEDSPIPQARDSLKESLSDFMHEWINICKLVEEWEKQQPQETKELYDAWCEKALNGKFSK